MPLIFEVKGILKGECWASKADPSTNCAIYATVAYSSIAMSRIAFYPLTRSNSCHSFNDRAGTVQSARSCGTENMPLVMG